MAAAPPEFSLATRFPELDAAYARLLDAARLSGAPPMPGLPPEAIRERVRAGNALCALGPEMREVVDVHLGPEQINPEQISSQRVGSQSVGAQLVGSQLGIRRYVPHRLRTDRVLVWFHGGGWMAGDIGYSEQFCRMLADGAGCEVHSVDYRLAPEHPFPAAVDDALAAVRWSASGGRVGSGERQVPDGREGFGAREGFGWREVVVGGDSAGGNLAAVVAQELVGGYGGSPGGQESGVRIAGQLLVYPVLDTDRSRPSYLAYDGLVLGVAEMGWFFDQYLPREQDRTNPRAAPLRAAAGGPGQFGAARNGLGGLPPAIVAVAGHDPLRDEGVAYAERLTAAGVPTELLEFRSLPHGFLRFTGPVPAAADAAARIVATAARMVTATAGMPRYGMPRYGMH